MRTWAHERKFVMPVKQLPPDPDLDHLKHQARDLIELHAAQHRAAAQRLREFHPAFRGCSDAEIFAASLKLSDAQLSIARERGFPSWTRLRGHVQNPSRSNSASLPYRDRIEDPVFRQALDLLDGGDAEGLHSHLELHPDLPHQHVVFEGGNYFRNPTLLEFVAENPIRNSKMAANVVRIAEIIIAAGAQPAALNETLSLVSTGRVPRECHRQVPLIDLLCDHGADPNSALRPAALHGEHEAVEALLARGAKLDLPIAAALGRIDDFSRLFPVANAHDRHLALASAAQFGHIEIVRQLLDAGEDPDRYNPPGAHSHSTPLHQAAFAGHERMVRLLVERGARLDIKDVLWQGTPADWAAHGEQLAIESWLRAEVLQRQT
jgi:hypothetical protein